MNNSIFSSNIHVYASRSGVLAAMLYLEFLTRERYISVGSLSEYSFNIK